MDAVPWRETRRPERLNQRSGPLHTGRPNRQDIILGKDPDKVLDKPPAQGWLLAPPVDVESLLKSLGIGEGLKFILDYSY